MVKGLKILGKVLATILCVVLGVIGAVLLTPFVVLCLIVGIPLTLVQDIWGITYYTDEEN